jgi:hypothetical protein
VGAVVLFARGVCTFGSMRELSGVQMAGACLKPSLCACVMDCRVGTPSHHVGAASRGGIPHSYMSLRTEGVIRLHK